MFTTIQGSLEDCLDIARKMHESVFSSGASRVSTVVKIDDRRDSEADMEKKARSVEEKPGEG